MNRVESRSQPTDLPALEAAARAWMAGDPEARYVEEIEGLVRAREFEELRARFGHTLEFGTAGLRGPLGAGPARMNVAVVRTATAGLCRWLDAADIDGPVVVGHDARRDSDRLAVDAAAVVAATGREAVLRRVPSPTPLIAFAVRDLDAAAGIVVTASHNPATDNGYKVYDRTGSQIVPPADEEISAAIRAGSSARDVPIRPERIAPLDEAITARYAAMARRVLTPGGPRSLSTVYTPVHGVGGELFRHCMDAAGFDEPWVVPAQAEPDPDFPTAPFPNPEEPRVLDLALADARARDADLVIAHDPDADRLAVALPDPRDGEWRALTGDDVGALLGWQLLRRTTGNDRVVASTVVSATWLARIAASFGVPHRTTLTGFKWVSRAGDVDGRRLVFGYEEALGYAVSPEVRDKDGITAALVFAELTAELRAEGRTVHDLIAQLAHDHGGSATGQVSVRFDGIDASEHMAELMSRLRRRAPSQLAGRDVVASIDLLTGDVQGSPAGAEQLDLPPADVLYWDLGAAGRALVRPSGTEPKVKCYFEVPFSLERPDVALLVDTRSRAAAVIAELGTAIRAVTSS